MNAFKSAPTAPMSTPDAQAYADHVEALSRATPAQPAVRAAYGSLPGQQFEVYEPEQTNGAPVLVFLHGGAWTHGGLEWLRFMAPTVLSMPAVLVAVTYRLAPQHRWPAAFEDTCAALAAIYELVQQRGYDSRRIVVAGHSAGGHLAALATLRGDFPWIHACFPVSSRYDLHTSEPAPGSGEERVYKLVLADPAQDAEASPLRFVRGNTIPFHIIWGENDFPRIRTTSQAMVDALQKEGCSVTHAVVPAAGHFDTHLSLQRPDDPWYARLKREFAPKEIDPC
ncbi:MAG TPA: alpha/beta hydrolase [Pusillimonas sp.]|uniref:alpha/beta hydrolase n=1 Tax=Pusillimonas sp. TaxID=3040095 RepID=UPI002C6CC32A|nr:alpha/beta hydrolase [Pusillimonas sp.]HUH86761.1 alpha/beta hydrolase [Pusillimonas sp.]